MSKVNHIGDANGMVSDSKGGEDKVMKQTAVEKQHVARVEFRHLPNFKPVAAIALFAGFYFAGTRSKHAEPTPSNRMRLAPVAAAAVPIAIMAASDWFLGGYDLL